MTHSDDRPRHVLTLTDADRLTLRSEALARAVQLNASNPSGVTDHSIVQTAAAFEKFLEGE